MKIVLVPVTFAAFLLAGSAAFAWPPGGGAGPTGGASAVGGGTLTGPGTDYGQASRKRHAIFRLLQEGKRIQLADGGKLTDAHRQELQQKLDAIRAGNY